MSCTRFLPAAAGIFNPVDWFANADQGDDGAGTDEVSGTVGRGASGAPGEQRPFSSQGSPRCRCRARNRTDPEWRMIIGAMALAFAF
jgi:hypothetical protein